MDQSIKDLFAAYEKAFATFDSGTTVSLFAPQFMAADPKRSRTFRNGMFFRVFAWLGSRRYQQMGMNSAKILSLTPTPISDQYLLVKAHYGVKFRKTGDRLIEFDVSYLVSKVGEEPKIILFISHEDEEKTMRELGLMD